MKQTKKYSMISGILILVAYAYELYLMIYRLTVGLNLTLFATLYFISIVVLVASFIFELPTIFKIIPTIILSIDAIIKLYNVLSVQIVFPVLVPIIIVEMYIVYAIVVCALISLIIGLIMMMFKLKHQLIPFFLFFFFSSLKAFWQVIVIPIFVTFYSGGIESLTFTYQGTFLSIMIAIASFFVLLWAKSLKKGLNHD